MALDSPLRLSSGFANVVIITIALASCKSDIIRKRVEY